MRQVLSGTGVDTTATVLAWLKANKAIALAHLYLIGEADDPAALWLTDWESPLTWSLWGTFQATNIVRGQISSKIGVEVDNLDLTWSPRNTALTASIATASPYQLARLGGFDMKRVRVWRCYMPTPGDADTFGAMELFGGFIGNCEVSTGMIKFSVPSYLYVLSQKVPSGVIEVTNILASYTGGSPPRGYSQMLQFAVVTGSTTTQIICDMTSPSPGNIPAGNLLTNGYLVFNGGPGATLAGQFSTIGANGKFTDGHGDDHTIIDLYSPLPWAPTPGVDTFYVSGASPVDQADGDYFGFPYVPAPETAA